MLKKNKKTFEAFFSACSGVQNGDEDGKKKYVQEFKKIYEQISSYESAHELAR